ncbi:MAG: hypothetical protein R3F35_04495 [Myxococcota bacterium]
MLAPAANALRLCLHPARVPFEADDERTVRIERTLAEHFERAGIAVVPSDEVEALIETVDARSGAIFDPATGRIDAEKRAAFEADVEQSVRTSFGCTGWIEVGLQEAAAWYDGTSASWDGQRAQINSTARIASQILIGALVGVYQYETGWIPVTSLFVRVADLQNQDVAFRSAGVEALFDISLSRGQDRLPLDRWLRDEDAVEEAMTSALGKAIERLRSSGRPAGSPAPDFAWE